MASRKENLKALFSNTRSRVIILFTASLLLIAVIIGFIKFSSLIGSDIGGSARLAGGPGGIQSVPGSINPTEQYAALQETQNIQQAQQAQKTGSSAIPTIIRSQAFGAGVESVGPQGGAGAVGFETLAREDSGGPQQSLWIQSLKDDNCSMATVDKVVSQGAVLTDLKSGCSCIQLKADGYNFTDLNRVCSCKELKAAGFGAVDMKAVGYTADRLRACGFDACELRGAGFTALQMKNGGYSDGELKGSGFSDEDIARAGGLPDGITAAQVQTAGCSADSLKRLHDSGVSAAAIRRISGCSAIQLKAGGFNAEDLKNAGFSAADLLKAGFSPEELKAVGYSARDLLNAGVSADKLASLGFTPQEIKAAENELPPGVSAEDVKAAGCSVPAIKRERDAGISASLIHQYAGCSVSALKTAGFTDSELADAGFTPAQISSAKPISSAEEGLANPSQPSGDSSNPLVDDNTIRAAGCDVQKLHALFMQGVSATKIHALNGCSAESLKSAGYDATKLADAGFTTSQLLAAGFTPEELKQAGLEYDDAIRAAGCNPQQLHALLLKGATAKRIHDLNGCSASALKAAGYTAAQLLNAGFTPSELLAAGFTPDQLKQAAISNENAIRAAGCDTEKLHALLLQGVTAKQIHDLNGCSASALKSAGYDAAKLLDAGFTNAQLLAAGFTPDELKQAALINKDSIRAAACDPQKLHQLFLEGVSAKQIHDLNGCSADILKQAGYDAAKLLNAGFSPSELLAAGFTPDELKQATLSNENSIRAAGCDPDKLNVLLQQGITAKQIHDLNGCTANALKLAGYDAAALSDAGFTPGQLLAAGFNAQDLKQQPTQINDDSVRAAGCDPQKLHQLLLQGVSAKRIHDLNGCSADILKAAGYDAAKFANAGFTPAELLAAGFSADDIKKAGLNPVGVISTGRTANCSAESLQAAHALGVSASTIKQTLGCSAKVLKDAGYSAAELKSAGFTAAELKNAGFSALDLKNAGFSAKDLRAAGFTAQQLKTAGFDINQLKDAGFSAADLKNAGYSAEQLKAAGFSATALKDAGYSAEDLRKAGYSAKELTDAGFTATQLKNAGYSDASLQEAGFSANESGLAGLQAVQQQPGISSSVTIPPLNGGTDHSSAADSANAKQLQEILKRQQAQVAEQRYQQKIQQKTAAMLGAANQTIQGLKTVSQQAYIAGSAPTKEATDKTTIQSVSNNSSFAEASIGANNRSTQQQALVKAGDVMFAVLDTSVNSDEPGPILATIVSGKFNGAKLIGSFTLPSNADKMVISFNTMSVPGAAKTTSINAYAIDPNTARTALASQTNHHYLTRYGSLFAATFLEGFGNAFQSANTTVTIGGAGPVQNTTITNGVGRSVLENAVIGLATLGKSWGQIAQQQFNLPTTVDLFSGTGIGVLFTQDLTSL